MYCESYGITISSVAASITEYNVSAGKYFTVCCGNKLVGDFCGYLSRTNILTLLTLVSLYSFLKFVYILYESTTSIF